MASPSTKEKLLSLVDDVQLIARSARLDCFWYQIYCWYQLTYNDPQNTKELFENIVAPKNQKLSASEHDQLTELLIEKDQELKATLKLASEQAEIQKKMEALQVEVEKQDQDIRQLQKHLKEAELLLATAIYQAKQKLQSISQANKQSISSEELIKYAHRISASNAVAAPLTWQQGDPRRPYPTDIEMRLGFLGRLSDLPINGHILQQQTSLSEIAASRPGSHPESSLTNQAGPFSWQPPSDLAASINASANHNSVHMDTAKGHNKENEDVEVMSTDSSSSSSSDSQ